MVTDNSFGYEQKITETQSPNGHKGANEEASVTLEQYAAYTRLPVDFLRSLNLKDATFDFSPAVRIPYPNDLGKEAYHRYRVALKTEPRFHAPSKYQELKPIPYGLHVITEARKVGYLLAVEGESDAQVCWYNDIPALGIPVVQAWKKFGKEWAGHLEGIPLLLVPVEADEGGERFFELLRSTDRLSGRVHRLPVTTPVFKDIGKFWRHAVDAGKEKEFKAAIEGAIYLQSTSTHLGSVEDGGSKTPATFGAVRLVDVTDSETDNYLIRNVALVGEPTYFYAAEGTGKSLVTTAIAIAIASPEVSSIFGYPVEEHGPVILFDSELNARRFKKRTAEICRGLGIGFPENLYYKNVVGLPPKTSFAELHGLAEHVDAVAAVIDSIGFATRGDPESYNDVRNQTSEFIDPLIRHGVTPIIVDHKPHVGDHMIGSVAKGYHGRFIFRVDDLDGDDRTKGERHIRLVNKKASFSEEGHKTTLTIRFEPGTIRFEQDEGESEEDPGTREPHSEVKVRQTLADGNKTKRAIHQYTGLKITTLGNVIPRMVRAGSVRVVGAEGKEYVYGLNRPDDPGNDEDHLQPSSTDPCRVEDGGSKSPPTSSEFRERDSLACTFVDTVDGLNEVAGSLSTKLVIGVDIETYPREETARSLDPRRGKIDAISLSGAPEEAFVIDRKAFDADTVREALKKSIGGKPIVTHNGGTFDLPFLRRDVGYEHDGQVFDTLVLDAMLFYATGPLSVKENWKGFLKKDKDEGYRRSLKEVAEKRLGIVLNKEERDKDWGGPISPEMASYAAQDAAVLIPIKDHLVRELESLGIGAVVEWETRFTPSMAYCSDNGFAMDIEGWLKHSTEARQALEAAEAECNKLAPDPPDDISDGKWSWNASNHHKIGRALEMLGAEVDRRPSTGNYITDEAALKDITRPKRAKEFAQAILRYRSNEKYATTWGENWLREPKVNSKGKIPNGKPDHLIVMDGRAHTKLNQLVATGRGSSRGPNFQNVPGELRRFFVAPPGRKLLDADYSQMEYAAAAYMAQDEHLLAPLREGEDFHLITARMILGQEATDEEVKAFRGQAKTVNFATLYGQGEKSLAKKLGVTETEARKYLEALFSRAPKLAEWCDKQARKAYRGVEFATTPLGRRRLVDMTRYNGVWKSNKAQMLNHPVQGACADGYKIAAALIWERHKDFDGNPLMVNMVHDEFVLEVDEGAAETDAKLLEALMLEGMKIAIGDAPVRVDVKICDRWTK